LITSTDTVTRYGRDTYNLIKSMGLDDIADVARNTGLSIEDVTNLKKHLFLERHVVQKQGGVLEKLEYFTPDEEIAYACKVCSKCYN
jgi:hypothetical protein